MMSSCRSLWPERMSLYRDREWIVNVEMASGLNGEVKPTFRLLRRLTQVERLFVRFDKRRQRRC